MMINVDDDNDGRDVDDDVVVDSIDSNENDDDDDDNDNDDEFIVGLHHKGNHHQYHQLAPPMDFQSHIKKSQEIKEHTHQLFKEKFEGMV